MWNMKLGKDTTCLHVLYNASSEIITRKVLSGFDEDRCNENVRFKILTRYWYGYCRNDIKRGINMSHVVVYKLHKIFKKKDSSYLKGYWD